MKKGSRYVYELAGYSGKPDGEKLYFKPDVHECGEIKDGVIFQHHKDRGCWVMAFRDLEHMYNLARDERNG